VISFVQNELQDFTRVAISTLGGECQSRTTIDKENRTMPY